jgi:putative addiction module component (TIGR02574 family)
MTIAEIKQLSHRDRLTLMEQLWESFQQDDENLTSPDWHAPIVENRLNTITDGTAEYVSLDDIRIRK